MVLEGVDKTGNLFGTIMYPHGDEAADLGLHLVQAGLAKVSPCPGSDRTTCDC